MNFIKVHQFTIYIKLHQVESSCINLYQFASIWVGFLNVVVVFQQRSFNKCNNPFPWLEDQWS